ncbi:MAG: type IV secretory system conjugative DNA transfer family protein [Clostridia bacterium]|nr:type IV secretory system conjugative DNA transfer family protein [Clostridia bacterium]
MLDGSGSGKSSAYSIPNAHQMLGSYIFTDPKGELYDATAGYLKANGYEIKVLNLVNPSNSDGYNPLMHISSDLDVDIIANTIIKGQKNDSGGDPFWDDNAEGLLKALIYYLLATRPPEEQNLGSCAELVRAANTNGGSNLLTELIHQLPQDHQARTNYKNIEIASDRTYASILSSLQSKLGKFDSKEIAGVTSTDTINFEDIGRKKTAVYVISSDTHTAYDFILTIFFSQMIQQLYNFADLKPDGVNAKLKVPVFFILDEFANIGKIPDFDKKISTSRSRGISFSVILQNLDQLEATYEKSYETIMGNCDTHVFLGSNSFKTVEYFSKLLGEKTISGKSVSKGKDPQTHKKSKTVNENLMARALMTPDELRRLDDDVCIIFEKGIKPIKAKKYYYFETSMLQDFKRNTLDHNKFEVGNRGIWRKYNPYNPYIEDEGEPVKDLKVESLDDLFDEKDDFDKFEEIKVDEPEKEKVSTIDFSNLEGFENIGSGKENADSKNEFTNSERNNHLSEDMFSDLIGFEDLDDKKEEKASIKSNDTNIENITNDEDIIEIDVEKELEKKFNELFGIVEDE